ncbi:MAG: hypothetical protein ACNS62_17035 [Candidatus Cyclobacteriaceae bacterium M3_2C_046]
MNYFKILGIIFGLAALLKPVYMHLIPWNEQKFIAKAYQARRPRWILPVALLGLFLVIFTWYKEITTTIDYSWIITLLFSLTAIKAMLFLFDYARFQKWVTGMLDDNGKRIVKMDYWVGLFGLIVLTFSIVLL